MAGGAESIIVPEEELDVDKVCKRLIQGRNRGKLHSIIILAEGVGNAYELSKSIEEKTDIETRVTILGHIQRGGTPTAFDRIVASRMGFKAVELLMEGKSGVAVGIKENKIYSIPLEEALNVEKVFDEKMFDIAKVLSI